MRVLVAGATGAIGRPLVTRLRAAGHDVWGMARSEERAALVRAAGAEAVVADALDREAVRRAVAGARPDTVIHQLTAIPDDYDPRRHGKLFAATDRLRAEATPILASAAAEAGARRFIAQSIAFAYAPEGSAVKDEDDRLADDAPDDAWRTSVGALRALEAAATGQDGLEGVVLRYGFLYGPGTSYAASGPSAEMVRRRRFPIVGRGQGMFSFIHVDDAAGATLDALEGPPGIYNIVDDEPAPVREWLPEWAEAIGAPKPIRVPVFVARLAAGALATQFMTEQRGASNARAKRELGFAPAHPSWREGFRNAIA